MKSLVRAVLLGVICLAGLPREGQAQRQVKHLNSLNFQAGQGSEGNYYRFGYSRFLGDKNRLDLVTLRESGRVDNPKTGPNTAYSSYDFGVGLAPTLFHIGEALYVHSTIQAHVRYDRLVTPASEINNRLVRQGTSVGPELGLSADLYLVDWLSISGQASQGYLFLRPPVTSWPRYFGGGLHFHFR